MKKLVLSLLLVFTHFVYAQNVNSLDPTQVYNTGNLTTFNQNGSQTTTPWQNVGQWGGQLQCWGPGNPGYCGPNPYVNASGNGVINFSYGYTDLFQVVNIASALPNSGTGLRVNGFNFGFMAKNGNGWDNGQQDFLVAYVNFYDNKGQLAQNYNYGAQTNQKYNWTQFNFSETFTTPYASKDLSTARYGFVGYDTNFWAGPYGPEIYNVNFSLKYSVDPCYTNVLYSPSCPGYMEALAKLNPAPSIIEPVNTQTNTTIIEPLSQSSTISTTSNTNTNTNSSGPVNQVNIVTTTPTTTITATIPTSNNNVSSTSIGLSVVARNQQREQNIAMQASQNAINAADQTSQQTQQEALNVAQSSSNASNASSSNPMARINLTPQRSEQASFQLQASQSITSLASVALPGQQSNTNRQIDTNRFGLTTSSSLEATNIQSTAISNVLQEQAGQSQTQATFALLPPQQPQQIVTQTMPIVTSDSTQINSQFSITNQQSIFTANEFSTSESQKFLTDRTNPINQIIEGKGIELPSIASVPQKTTVNTNVSDNEIAGGVNIGRMATIPAGYNQYLGLALADASFYAPKEIYKNQKVIDNARVLRQLSSDRLHKEMVEQQYRR